MKNNKIYKYDEEKLYLTGQKTNKKIIVEQGDIIEIKSLANNSSSYEIKITHKNKETNKFQGNDILIKKLIESSIEIKNQHKLEQFDIDTNIIDQLDTVKIIQEKANEFVSNIKKTDLAENAKNILKYINKKITQLSTIQNANIHNLNDNEQKTLTQLKNEVSTFDFSIKNTKKVKYLKDVEKYAKDTLNDAVSYLKDAEFDMYRVRLADMRDIIEVAVAINKGDLLKAYNKARDLDTFVRDGFSEEFWTNLEKIAYPEEKSKVKNKAKK